VLNNGLEKLYKLRVAKDCHFGSKLQFQPEMLANRRHSATKGPTPLQKRCLSCEDPFLSHFVRFSTRL
jgi:hypothetical protein